MDYDKFNKIKTFILDVDGVLTNSNLLVTESGELLRTMSVKDGQAIKIAINKGYEFAIITKGNSKGVKSRLKGLGIQHIYDNVQDKIEVLDQLVKDKVLDLSTTVYMGDDLPDMVILKKVLLPSCPKDAVQEVLNISEYVSSKNGGEGCVREIIEKVLKAQDNWQF